MALKDDEKRHVDALMHTYWYMLCHLMSTSQNDVQVNYIDFHCKGLLEKCTVPNADNFAKFSVYTGAPSKSEEIRPVPPPLRMKPAPLEDTELELPGKTSIL